MKAGEALEEAEGDDFYGLEGVRQRVRAAADKTFLLGPDGRWVDTAYRAGTETVKVEAYSAPWFELLARGDKVARYLAVGDRVVVVLDGKAYEIAPPPG
jgi:hypothetical protein